MRVYYEVSIGDAVQSFDELEEAIAFADEKGCEEICEIGGSYTDYRKCDFCGEWEDTCNLNEHGDCSRCEAAIMSHGGY